MRAISRSTVIVEFLFLQNDIAAQIVLQQRFYNFQGVEHDAHIGLTYYIALLCQTPRMQL